MVLVAINKGMHFNSEDLEAVKQLLHLHWEKEGEDWEQQDEEGRENHPFVVMVHLRDTLGLNGELQGDLTDE